MRIIVDIGHPAHVHFFKNFIWEMEKKNHDVLITARDKEISLNLLDSYGFKYTKISTMKKGKSKLIYEWTLRDINLLKICLKFKPDLMLGIGGTTVSHVSKLTGIKSIIFTDYPLWYDKILTHPWANIILTPTSFSKDLGKKHLKFDGYKELSYLHPDLFHPDKNIYDLMGIDRNERFVILRFASFDAAHDINAFGFDSKTKIELVNRIKKYARVFIASAVDLPDQLVQYNIPIPLEKIHHALYFADLLVSDSQTMTTEAAVLGTPVVRCNSWVGPKDAINFVELENKYDLIYNFNDANLALDKCIELLKTPNIKAEWRLKREKLLNDKINVTDFLVWLAEIFGRKTNTMQDYYQEYIQKNMYYTDFSVNSQESTSYWKKKSTMEEQKYVQSAKN